MFVADAGPGATAIRFKVVRKEAFDRLRGMAIGARAVIADRRQQIACPPGGMWREERVKYRERVERIRDRIASAAGPADDFQKLPHWSKQRLRLP